MTGGHGAIQAVDDLKASRFNLWTTGSGGELLLFNSFSTAFVRVDGATGVHVTEALQARRRCDFERSVAAIEDDGTVDLLLREGFLVRRSVDELLRARGVHESLAADNALHLILLPTEQCNFRCVYCYEDFLRPRMPTEVIQGVVRLVAREAPTLRALTVGWFGGEPLAAINVIEMASAPVLALCDEYGIHYNANVTTNGYLLTSSRRARLYAASITDYQVTLDGPPEVHDRLRKLAGGGGTFDTIFANLIDMRSDDFPFRVNLRVNYTPESLPYMSEFVRMLGTEFAGDGRFQLHFHAVGRWGGPNDETLDVCDSPTIEAEEVRLMALGLEAGFGLDAWRESLKPHGSVCYAANPRSFVIGSDGTVYKCTVAFRDPRNQVGRLTPEGELEIAEDLLQLWTSTGEEVDTGCQQCAFRPACQGNLCPLERLNRDGEKVCPSFKVNYSKHLPLLAAEAEREHALG